MVVNKLNNMKAKINFILNHIKNTHTKQDFKDLHTFSKDEINEIYNNILKDNQHE